MGAELSQHCFLAPLHAATHALTGGGRDDAARDAAAPPPAVGPLDAALATPGARACARRVAAGGRTAG